PVYVVCIWLGVQWWASWYPGFEPGGGGYVVQRLLSTKNENHAVGAAILFNILHFVVRPWPWIITALAAAVVLPVGSDKEMLYPQAIVAWLPPGLKGLLIASFLAAFMSTIATHLNWGASYIVNDVLQGTRFLPQSDKGKIWFSRIVILFLAVGAVGVSQLMTSVSQGWELILMFSAGTGPVYLLRWYWKKITAASEIVAMGASFIFSLVAASFAWPQELRLAFVALCATVSWVLVTLLIAQEKSSHLKKFEALVRPSPWKLREVLVFIAAVVTIYSAFFALGELLKGNYDWAALHGILVAVFSFLISRLLQRTVE
ncbi:MAG TPA: hypothetical protein PLY93_00895, partial [Turneriella sp.]|nr:hypothetical protein [Turneriella sp.]